MQEKGMPSRRFHPILAPKIWQSVGAVEIALGIIAFSIGAPELYVRFASPNMPDIWINELVGVTFIVSAVALILGGVGFIRSPKAGFYANLPLTLWAAYLFGTN